MIGTRTLRRCSCEGWLLPMATAAQTVGVGSGYAITGRTVRQAERRSGLGEKQMFTLVKRAGTCLAGGALLAVACVAAPGPATAQQSPWQFTVTPYMWLAGVKGTTTTPASGITFNREFGDIFKDLSAIPVMFGAEVRKGRAGLAFDLVWLKLSSEIDTRNILFNDGKSSLSMLQVSLTGFYRVIEEPAGSIDVGAGFRLWSVSSKAKLNAGLLPAISSKVDKTFADPILAARFDLRLGGRWSLTAYGDVGGFGISSDVTWQALGTINYRAADWVDVRLGWRHLAVDRKKINLDFSGPILAATFRF